MNKTGISRVIVHRDRKVTVLQSMFDGKLHDEFVDSVVKLIPVSIKIERKGSGTYGKGSAYNGGFTRSGVSFKLADPTQATELKKVFEDAKRA